MPSSAKRFPIVGRLSSAAKMPLPGARSAPTVESRAFAFMGKGDIVANSRPSSNRRSRGLPGPEGRGPRQLLPQCALLRGRGAGHLDPRHGVKVAAAPVVARKPQPAHAQLASRGGPGRHPERRGAVERADLRLGAEHGLPWREVEVAVEVGPPDGEVRVAGEAHPQEQVARRSAGDPRPALAGQADALALAHPGGYAHLVRVGPVAVAVAARAPKRDLAKRPAQGLLEGDHDVGLDIAPRRGEVGLGPALLAERPGIAAAGAEERLEEVAEAGAAEFERGPSLGPPWAAAGEAPRPALLGARVLPVRAQLVVAPALLRVPEDLVGLVDLLELRLAGGLVLGHVRVVDAGELPERHLYLLGGRGPLDSQGLVVILELDGHGLAGL